MSKSSFENKLINGLADCGVVLSKNSEGDFKLGAAVSGGADSISLLLGLLNISTPDRKVFTPENPLEIITVNHNIRPAEESGGDAAFVVELCEKLKEAGRSVNCTVVELPQGQVFEVAGVRQAGVEEAARYLRYKSFENFIKEKHLDYLCLAHNKNDQVETVLMRFLQGAPAESATGISIKREKYIRPLLNISRREIEAYLNNFGATWREDKTNQDTNYYRNNIRHNLIPFLDEHFGGWEKAVLAGAVKAGEDADVIQENVLKFPMEVEKGVLDEITHITFKLSDFCNEKPGVQKRILIKAANLIGENARIPSNFLADFIAAPKGTKVFHNTEISVKKDIIFVKKHCKKVTDLVFFDIIEENGVYDFPFGTVNVTFNNSNVFLSINGWESKFSCCGPFVIRNMVQGDMIKNSCGNMKKVADIFSDWHVMDSHRKLIPVVYELKDGCECLKCVLGCFLGYKDWIVK